MKRLLKIIVKTEIFKNENLPDPTNKRFFPRTSTIRNHVTHAKRKLCHSLKDQECLQEKINQWETTNKSVKIFFRSKSSAEQDGDENSSDDINTDDDDDHDDIRLGKTKRTPLLFVYQNGWQRLFSRYGKELTLLDATYRTTRYALPLFFMVVKTNIDYQIVAVFVTENETEDSTQEPLSIIKSWNKDVSPTYGMTDYCTEEFKAMENIFEGMLSVNYFNITFLLHLKDRLR